MIQTLRQKSLVVLQWKESLVEFSLFRRLNIPPFVPARTVLEGLESEDSCESDDCVKNENTKVKEPTQSDPHTLSLNIF